MSSRLINLPSRFELTTHGGWCSPLGTYTAQSFADSALPTLRSRGLDPRNHDPRWNGDIEKLALFEGWFKVSYDQAKLTGHRQFDESKTAKRFLTITFSPDGIDRKQQARIKDVAKYFEYMFLVGQNNFNLEAFYFGNVRLTGKPQEVDYTKPIQVSSFSLSSRKYRFFEIDLLRAYQKASRQWQS